MSLVHPQKRLETYFHLELGGANYGGEGHSGGKVKGGHKDQLKTLRATLKNTVKIAAPQQAICFVINDLKEEACLFAQKQIAGYATEQFPDRKIKVVILPKSYREIEVQRDLGVASVDSIHLKNPDRLQQREDFKEQDKTGWMTRLAKESKTGLQYLTFYNAQNPRVNPYARDRLPCSAMRLNRKSTHELRYQEQLYVHLKRSHPMNDEDYLYVHPDGQAPDTHFHTRLYSFTLREAKDVPSESEKTQVLEARTALRTMYALSEKSFKPQFESYLAELEKNPLYSLLKVFSVQKLQHAIAGVIEDSKERLELEVGTLDVDEFEEEYEYKKGLVADFLDNNLKELKRTLQQHFNDYQSLPMQEIRGSGVKGRSLSEYRKRVREEGASFADAFSELGLKKAFDDQFDNDEAFLNSELTLVQIFETLTQREAALNAEEEVASLNLSADSEDVDFQVYDLEQASSSEARPSAPNRSTCCTIL